MTKTSTPPYDLPPWLGDEFRLKCLEKLSGWPFFPGAVAYATYGPIAVDFFVTKQTLQKSVQPHQHFCPVSFRAVNRFGEAEATSCASLGAETAAIHLWNSNYGRITTNRQPAGSFTARRRGERLDD